MYWILANGKKLSMDYVTTSRLVVPAHLFHPWAPERRKGKKVLPGLLAYLQKLLIILVYSNECLWNCQDNGNFL